jgi:phosphoribosylformylglycinamidine synthase
MKFIVTIQRRDGIADPEGVTTARALVDLGYSEVRDVHFGRTIAVEVDGDDPAEAEGRVVEMCERLLANPVIEGYRVEMQP